MCVILQEVRLRYFSFLTLLQSFEVRSTLDARLSVWEGRNRLLRHICGGFSVLLLEPLFRVFSSVFARSLSYVLYSNFDSRIASCCPQFIRSLSGLLLSSLCHQDRPTQSVHVHRIGLVGGGRDRLLLRGGGGRVAAAARRAGGGLLDDLVVVAAAVDVDEVVRDLPLPRGQGRLVIACSN